MISTSKFRTLVMIDLETTGLIYDEPKITELAMIAVNVTTLEEMKPEDELPRVLNKFVKFFDPIKLLRTEVVELTGLNNRMLMDYAPFSRETVVAMESFLNDLQKPLCFVAHNGNLFDFPILFDEIRSALSIPPSCIDINNQCCDEINPTISNESSDSKDASVQTTTTNLDSDKTSLFSIDCADSLMFFREMHRLLNDKDLLQEPIKTLPSETTSTLNETECNNNNNNNASVDPVDSIPSANNNNTNTSSSFSRVGYVEIPIKYMPSLDPARQQQLSMKLIKIYEREFPQSTSHLKSHRAEDDCLMLLAILKRYLPDWLDWIEVNHRPLTTFSSLPLTASNNTKKSSFKTVVNKKPLLKF